MPKRLHLFQGYGVELEYMIVDKNTLDVKPVADLLLKDAAGRIVNEFHNGRISWSNELVLHVLEIKSSGPDTDLSTLGSAFYDNVVEINERLSKYDAIFMPTAAHPWMNPEKETVLWPYENNEIYQLYDKMFNCKGHGWSNLQSTHINLPFYDDEEFSKLHTAIRVILPLLPALSASSPILNGDNTGYLDKRLYYYQNNQRNIPSITGKVIPERLFSKRAYQKTVYDRIAADISHFNAKGLLEPLWINSRGAIARFDRGAIEIRILDIQESPKADIAIVRIVDLLLKALVNRRFSTFDVQEKQNTDRLSEHFRKVVRQGREVVISDRDYLAIFGLKEEQQKVALIWDHIFEQLSVWYPEEYEEIDFFVSTWQKQGSLAERIVQQAGSIYSRENLSLIYRELTDNLQENEYFGSPVLL